VSCLKAYSIHHTALSTGFIGVSFRTLDTSKLLRFSLGEKNILNIFMHMYLHDRLNNRSVNIFAPFLCTKFLFPTLKKDANILTEVNRENILVLARLTLC